MELMESLLITPSALENFCMCGRVWEFAFIKGIKVPPGISMLAGTGFHKGAEHNFRQKIHTRKDLKKAEIEEVAIESLRTRIEEEGIYLAGEERSKAVVINEAERGLRTISGTFSEDVAPRIQPVFVEPDMPLIPLEGFTKEVNLGGHPDVIDERGIIPDWKTSLTKFKSQRDADQSLQLTGYHILATKAKEVWEDMPDIKNIGFWSITPKGHRWLPTERGQAHWDSYIERAKWMVSCIEKRIFHRAAPGHWKCQPKFCGYYGTHCTG